MINPKKLTYFRASSGKLIGYYTALDGHRLVWKRLEAAPHSLMTPYHDHWSDLVEKGYTGCKADDVAATVPLGMRKIN